MCNIPLLWTFYEDEDCILPITDARSSLYLDPMLSLRVYRYFCSTILFLRNNNWIDNNMLLLNSVL